ncbi:hypothetical protein B0T26DRAFT_648737, partial [Lasiosphaeria miniovina]
SCYRALFPCPTPSAVSAASAFCATITAGGVTATNFPTRATAACGTSPGRYVSACQCGPTCSTSVATPTSSCAPTPSNGGLVYGDFECGTAPWIVQVVQQNVVANASGIGLTGAKSFVTKFTGPDSCSTTSCTDARIISPSLPVTPGVSYKLTFGTWMDGTTGGFVGVMINGQGLVTIDALDFTPTLWHFSQVAWMPPAGVTSAVITFEWIGPEARLDTITFAPVTAYCGSHPPLGFLPDGDFECGAGGWTTQKPDPGAQAGISGFAGVTINPSNPPFGSFAWKAYLATDPNPANQELGVSARLVSPVVPVTPGKTYMLAYTTYFDRTNFGFVGVMINNVPLQTTDPGDRGVGTLYFAPRQLFWTAPAGNTTAQVKLEVVADKAGTVMIDSVILVEATGEN